MNFNQERRASISGKAVERIIFFEGGKLDCLYASIILSLFLIIIDRVDFGMLNFMQF